jgi:hypothetical protein
MRGPNGDSSSKILSRFAFGKFGDYLNMRYVALWIIASPLFIASLTWSGEPPKVFTVNCVSCHGDQGDGMGPAGKYMNPHPRNWKTGKFKNGDSLSDIIKTVHQGLKGTSMPGFPDLSPEDLKVAAEYVRSIRGK